MFKPRDAVERPAASARRAPRLPALRLRLLILATACITSALTMAASLVLEDARTEQAALEQHAFALARAGASAVDREVAATFARLEGLAASPSIASGDLEALHRQLVATPRPRGTGLTLWNPERQLTNSRVPFATQPLPSTADFGEAAEEAVPAVFGRGERWVSNLLLSPLAGFHEVSAVLPVRLGGQVAYALSGDIPIDRLRDLLAVQALPQGWAGALIDRHGVVLAGTAAEGLAAGGAARGTVLDFLGGTAAAAGPAEGTGLSGAPAMLAFARAGESGWAVVVETPLDAARAPVMRTLRRLGAIGLGLLAAGALVALLVARRIEGPFAALGALVTVADRRQREMEARHRAYWNHTSEALFAAGCAADGTFTFEAVNPALQRLLGKRAADLQGRRPAEVMPDAAAARLADAWRACIAAGAPLRSELALDMPRGAVRWEASLAPVRDEASGETRWLFGSLHDVTARREAEDAARATRKLLQSTIDALSEPVAILDERGMILRMNAAWRAAAPADAVGADHLAACAPGQAYGEAGAAVAAGLRGMLRGESDALRLEYGREAPGGRRWFQLRATCFRDAAARRLVLVQEDITEVRHAAEELAWLSARLQDLRDEERRRIARELHDQTAQNLLAATLAIGAARAQARDLGDAAGRQLDESCALIDQTQGEIRTLSYLLHPPLLDEVGLGAALAWFGEGLARRSGLRVVVEVPQDSQRAQRLPREAETALFRVAQEALGNAQRHARASTVWLRLEACEGPPRELRLSIRDDGQGIGPEPPPGRLGVGIPGMRERLRAFGGRLSIGPGAGGGTLVEAVLPLPPPAAG